MKFVLLIAWLLLAPRMGGGFGQPSDLPLLELGEVAHPAEPDAGESAAAPLPAEQIAPATEEPATQRDAQPAAPAESATTPEVVVEKTSIKVAPEQEPSCPAQDFSRTFVCLLNQYRAAKGLGALASDPLLAAAAAQHSEWMSQNGTFSHTGTNGSSFYERCEAAGTRCLAENLAAGVTSPVETLELWKQSPPHNANMLGSFGRLGISLVEGYVTLVLQ